VASRYPSKLGRRRSPRVVPAARPAAGRFPRYNSCWLEPTTEEVDA
jgi:hypothetical protein